MQNAPLLFRRGAFCCSFSLDHQPDDLLVRFLHAVLAQAADALDGGLDVLHHDAVAALELLMALVHVVAQQRRVHRGGDLRRAGGLCAVADDAGYDGQCVDHRVDGRFVAVAAEVDDARACTGTGVGPTKITRVIGVSKAYVTRVGEGPFPTELFGEDGEWLRAQGHEYGVTTGRPRRCGWFDAVVNRYAAQVNGLTDIVLTKLDVLTGLKEIPLCVAYDVNGERRDDMPTDQAEFAAAKPIYESMPGWDEDISQVHDFNDLPKTCQDYVKRLEELSGCRISVIGTGPQRDHIIQINSLID